MRPRKVDSFQTMVVGATTYVVAMATDGTLWRQAQPGPLSRVEPRWEPLGELPPTFNRQEDSAGTNSYPGMPLPAQEPQNSKPSQRELTIDFIAKYGVEPTVGDRLKYKGSDYAMFASRADHRCWLWREDRATLSKEGEALVKADIANDAPRVAPPTIPEPNAKMNLFCHDNPLMKDLFVSFPESYGGTDNE